MTTAYITHQRYLEHRIVGYNHVENPNRLLSVWAAMDEGKLTGRMMPLEPLMAEKAHLLAVHTPDLIARYEQLEAENRAAMIDPDTYALPTSYGIARLSAGGVIRAVQAVVTGEADNALAAVRPPGHHATPDRAMGFCLLSNVAIGAQYALDHLNLTRVLIVDYDVHHGNGTQDVFYNDDRVFFLSLHQYPFYPSTGKITETGAGKGKGYTLNVPLSAGHGDKSYAQAFEQIVWKAARRYRPELIIVSAGFDAHWRDPLGMMRLSLTGYAHITRELIRMAQELCDGKIVFVMEGGYDLEALGNGVRNIAHALLGEDEVSDPLGDAGGKGEPDAQPVFDEIARLHGL
jgi:acetoin utilization deacetylase AcuC-like enzyme